MTSRLVTGSRTLTDGVKTVVHQRGPPGYAPSVSDRRKSQFRFWSEGYQALHASSQTVKRSTIDPALLELIKMRASQINGCAYCIDMHAKDARAAGETEQRLYALSAWRETPFFSARERAALAVTEAVTLVSQTQVPQTVIDAAAALFPPDELTEIVYAVIDINAWNRLAITTGAPEPGSYHRDTAPG